MITVLLSVLLFTMMISLMAIGVVFLKRPLSKGCSVDPDTGKCFTCGKDTKLEPIKEDEDCER